MPSSAGFHRWSLADDQYLWAHAPAWPHIAFRAGVSVNQCRHRYGLLRRFGGPRALHARRRPGVLHPADCHRLAVLLAVASRQGLSADALLAHLHLGGRHGVAWRDVADWLDWDRLPTIESPRVAQFGAR